MHFERTIEVRLLNRIGSYADGFQDGFVAGRKDASEFCVGGPIEARLARLLLRQPYSAKFTHQKLAEKIGTTRESITRVVSKWRVGGVIRGDLQTRNVRRLERLQWLDFGHA